MRAPGHRYRRLRQTSLNSAVGGTETATSHGVNAITGPEGVSARVPGCTSIMPSLYQTTAASSHWPIQV
jgi:hypothetical protein